ncbi:hypothetical protein BGZ65_010892 [Modicella reniformis]|uniref:Uncharacterized protein n=1 Tax=Modicella reniformis TaxID=1440133 RepID=A0A9P6JIJ7_9FUNG|nr:hypothetical protein BGZ65_010892 [Modicella reniformis]
MKIKRVDDLSFDDINFIQRGGFTRLVMEHTHREDGNRLVKIFRHNRLKESRLSKATTLDMKLQELVKTITAETLDRNKSFLVNCRRLTLAASLSQGETLGMSMTIAQLSDLTSDDLTFIRQGQITWMMIETIPQESDGDRLEDILRHSPALQFHIRFKEERSLANTTAPELRLQDLLKMVTADSLTKIESLSINYGRMTLTRSILQGETQEMTMTIEQLQGLTSDDLIFIQQGHFSRLAIRHAPQKADEEQLADILYTIPRLSHLQIGCKSECFLAIINFMTTTRGKVVLDRGPSYLHSIELMGENLVSFDILGVCDNYNTYIQYRDPKEALSACPRGIVRFGIAPDHPEVKCTSVGTFTNLPEIDQNLADTAIVIEQIKGNVTLDAARIVSAPLEELRSWE